MKKVLSSVFVGALLTIGSAVMASGAGIRWRSGTEEPNSYLLALCSGVNSKDEDR